MIDNKQDSKFNLEERTSQFGADVISFCRNIKEDNITKSLINQVVRSATSVGANYREANGASSKKDFKNKIHICQKEAKETQHWLHMIVTAMPSKKTEAQKLWKECKEFTLIFGKIVSTMNGKKIK